ncbi:glycosyltransferase family 2 protein [Candidatus Chloroploca sp. M-50]|uniref:Glycosyltransferase family 2 protein n=1 Tax=Candidatus Chloroploca mongolica TaxID=2528176 RepID=A0ABS4D446_9CHLR|nr:glycosyltransferase family A protein [Candidatus Chloroploca mongolica]MBP1464209.1 glycosyltransferase family 2 protein [Candidatus Chloroploca mongolica]
MNANCVSVIIPVYNGERFLAEAIQSVLDQTLPPDKIIVVDDGSTDGSATLVHRLASTARLPIHYVYQENQGPAAARNCGLNLAQGDLIAFQDADDLWSAEKLALQVALLRQYPQAHAVTGYSQIVYVDHRDHGAITNHGRPGPILLLQESLFRRELFDLVGPFDPRLRGDEDVEWFLRLLEQPVELIIHPDVVLTYRRHETNLTGNLATSRHQFLLALQRAVVRRRQSPQANARTATVIFANAPIFRQDEEKNGST